MEYTKLSFAGNHEQSLDLDVSEVYVYFYDFPRNETKVSKIDNAAEAILSYETLNRDLKFIIFVSGFRSNITKKSVGKIRDAFRDFPHSYLIILDHSAYTSSDDGFIKSYERSVKHVYYIGKKLAQMLKQLRDGGVSPQRMHCIGHSLGGQILGYTGRIFIETTDEKISKITALDPAGPCFSNSLVEHQVRSGVAEYVEVYHCHSGGLGTSTVLADVDFFFNEMGHTQPNCRTPVTPSIIEFAKSAKCNHKSCIGFWAATVSHPEWFPALKCDSYKNFKEDRCSSNEMTTAGFWNPGTANGIYYVSTEGYEI